MSGRIVFANSEVLSSTRILLLVVFVVSSFTAVLSQPTLPACHPPFSPSTAYAASSLVSVASVNYHCVPAWSAYCSGAQNAPPGAPGTFASVAWSSQGPCSHYDDGSGGAPTASPSDEPSRSPSSAPSRDRGPYLGACPRRYDVASSVPYDAGDVVSVDDDVDATRSVHRCKAWPYSSFCNLYNFRPGTPNGSLGWTRLGWCDGSLTLSPTAAPTFDPATPGCPADYVPGKVYDAGDRVAYDPSDPTGPSEARTAYECSPIYSRHCPYRPPEIVAGEEAWVNLGHCVGTIVPTAGPTEKWPTWSPTVEYGRYGIVGESGDVGLEGSLHLVLFEETDPEEEGSGRRRRQRDLQEVDIDMDAVVLKYLQDNIGGEDTFETISVESTDNVTFELLVDPINGTLDTILVVAHVWKMNIGFSMTEGFRNWIAGYHGWVEEDDDDAAASSGRRLVDWEYNDYEEEEEEVDEEEGDNVVVDDDEYEGFEEDEDEEELDQIYHPDELDNPFRPQTIAAHSTRRLASVCSPKDYSMCCASKSLSSDDSSYCKKKGCSSSGCKKKSTSTKKKKKKKKRRRRTRKLEQSPLESEPNDRPRYLQDIIEDDLWGLDFLDVVRNYTRYDPTDVFAILDASDTTDVAVCAANRYVEVADIQDPYFSCDVYESNDCAANEDIVFDDADNSDVCSPGCPSDYVPGTPYQPGDRVSVDDVRAYECTPPFHPFCRQFGPQDLGGSQAWVDLGSCTGTMAPTPSPTRSPNTPGCPDPYDPSQTYGSGDAVSVDGTRAYACRFGNYAAFCNAGSIYAPGGPYSALGWEDSGPCFGTREPTPSPTVDPNAPMCPPEYSTSTAYGRGDEAAVGGIAYRCKIDDYAAFCNAGPIYAPGGTYSNLGWDRLGSCRYTSHAPTTSPPVSSPSSAPSLSFPTFSPTSSPVPLPSSNPSTYPTSASPSLSPSKNPTPRPL